jgi:hypothetical protein
MKLGKQAGKHQITCCLFGLVIDTEKGDSMILRMPANVYIIMASDLRIVFLNPIRIRYVEHGGQGGAENGVQCLHRSEGRSS